MIIICQLNASHEFELFPFRHVLLHENRGWMESRSDQVWPATLSFAARLDRCDLGWRRAATRVEVQRALLLSFTACTEYLGRTNTMLEDTFR